MKACSFCKSLHYSLDIVSLTHFTKQTEVPIASNSDVKSSHFVYPQFLEYLKMVCTL